MVVSAVTGAFAGFILLLCFTLLQWYGLSVEVAERVVLPLSLKRPTMAVTVDPMVEKARELEGTATVLLLAKTFASYGIPSIAGGMLIAIYLRLLSDRRQKRASAE